MIELSIVIPSRDAGPRLTDCLEALGRQRAPGGAFEVIVVDDGSTPPVDPSMPAPGGRFPLRIVRREIPGGVARARNAGWRAARGRVCLFLDDDIVADPDLVAAHIAAHPAPGPTVGVGRLTTHVRPGADWLAHRFAEQWNEHVSALDEGRPVRAADCYGGNLSIPTALLDQAGGFDEGFSRSEDVELGARLVEMGAALAYVPGRNEHRERKTGRSILAGVRANGRLARSLVERHRWLLEQTELGTFAVSGQRHMAARRLAMAAGIPPEPLVVIAPLIGGGRVARSLLILLLQLAYWAGVREGNPADEFARMTDGTAILLYHGFAPAGARPSRFVVPVDRFEAQLRLLLRRGHRPISLGTYLEHRREHRFPPPRSFVVTIDDAYEDVESLAAPVLRRLGIPATLFVVESAPGGANVWDRRGTLAGRAVLGLDALRRLRDAGFEIAPHSATHASLPDLPTATLEDEVIGASRRLEERIGPLVPAFAYPYGRSDKVSRVAVIDAGFVGLGIDEGLACPASPSANLPRIEVWGTDAPARVALAARIGGTRLLFRR